MREERLDIFGTHTYGADVFAKSICCTNTIVLMLTASKEIFFVDGKDTKTKPTAIPLPLSTTLYRAVKSMACGDAHVLFLTHDGSVYSYGSNQEGQLGIASSSSSLLLSSSECQQVIKGGAATVSCGPSSSACVMDNGRVMTWGNGRAGKLGYDIGCDEESRQLTPRYVDMWDKSFQPPTVVQVALGGTFTLFLTSDGFVYVCGLMGSGVLGIQADEKERMTRDYPTLELKGEEGNEYVSVPTLYRHFIDTTIKTIATGESHALALTKGGRLFSWGRGSEGQLGMGLRPASVSEPYRVRKFRDVKIRRINAASDRSFAIDSNGQVFSWGGRCEGQKGTKTFDQQCAPALTWHMRKREANKLACSNKITAFMSKESKVAAKIDRDIVEAVKPDLPEPTSEWWNLGPRLVVAALVGIVLASTISMMMLR